MAKLSQKELETLQSLNNEFTKTKGAIADVEIQKHSLINSLVEFLVFLPCHYIIYRSLKLQNTWLRNHKYTC